MFDNESTTERVDRIKLDKLWAQHSAFSAGDIISPKQANVRLREYYSATTHEEEHKHVDSHLFHILFFLCE